MTRLASRPTPRSSWRPLPCGSGSPRPLPRRSQECAAGPGARTPRAAFPILRRSPRPGPNMLDGLKMEENFQGAMETSASFSSLLGECSGLAPSAPRSPPGPGLEPARWDALATGEPVPRFLHSTERPSVLRPLGSLLLQTGRGPGLARGHRSPQSRCSQAFE